MEIPTASIDGSSCHKYVYSMKCVVNGLNNVEAVSAILRIIYGYSAQYMIVLSRFRV